MVAAVPALGRSGNVPLFCACFCLILSMYGGGFAAIPAYLADLFGVASVGAIHGRLLTAWSVAAVVGPVIITQLAARARAVLPMGASKVHIYDQPLALLAGLLVIGALLTLSARPIPQPLPVADREGDSRRGGFPGG